MPNENILMCVGGHLSDGSLIFMAFSLDVVLGCSGLVLHCYVHFEPFLCTYSPICLCCLILELSILVLEAVALLRICYERLLVCFFVYNK